MPFDSEGVFSRLHNWEDDRVNDIDIVTDHMDEEDDNFADGLSQCFLKNGNSKMEGNFNTGNFKLINVADGALPSDGVNRSQLDKASAESKSVLTEVMNAMVKVGDIKASTLSENHDNWLLCNGQEISRNTYSDLFEVIGESFGKGNGVTTFNVPDYRGKFLRGLGGDSASSIGATQDEGLPNITGSIGKFVAGNISGAFKFAGETVTPYSYGTTAGCINAAFDASNSNELYGASEHVTPINQAVNFFIKALKEE